MIVLGLGMTKSNLDLKGVKPIKLELDFLRMVYFIERYEEIQCGYLVVTTEQIRTRVNGWKQKYDIDDAIIQIHCVSLTTQEIQDLQQEKKANNRVMRQKVGSPNTASLATQGKNLMESKLQEIIEDKEQTRACESFLLKGIHWDYVGKK
ncbi:MAG: hypothetical protein AAFR59_07510 [Bacteroidota bacterium]